MNPGTVINGYRIVSKLGEGSYGTVYHVISELDGNPYALKCFVSENVIPDDWIREINVSVLLKGLPYIAQLRYYFSIDHSYYYLVYDLEEGDLDDYIRNTPWKIRMKNMDNVYRQLINGAIAMKSRGIYHSDIKPGNILYSSGHLKYNDFGLSLSSFCDQEDIRTPIGATPRYRAPEYKKSKLTSKTDGYSIGLVMLEYITGQRFYVHGVTDLYQVLSNSLGKKMLSYLKKKYSIIINEMSRLLESDYTKRMDVFDSKFSNGHHYEIIPIGPSGIILTKEQQSRFAFYFKIMETECYNKVYSIAYDCLARYYLQGKDITINIIHAICNLANAIDYSAKRRRKMIRDNLETGSFGRILPRGFDAFEERASWDNIPIEGVSQHITDEDNSQSSEHSYSNQGDSQSKQESDYYEYSGDYIPYNTGTSDYIPSNSNKSDSYNSDEVKYRSDGVKTRNYTLPSKKYFSNRSDPLYSKFKKRTSARDEYNKMEPLPDIRFGQYDYTAITKKQIDTELAVQYSLNGCISGCWQDPLHRLFDRKTPLEITNILLNNMSRGMDMFGNYSDFRTDD